MKEVTTLIGSQTTVERDKKKRKRVLVPGKVVSRFGIRLKDNTKFLYIYCINGGATPVLLDGFFTSYDEANTAINNYKNKIRRRG